MKARMGKSCTNEIESFEKGILCEGDKSKNLF